MASRLREAGGVLTFDFRGHGRSGGLSTVGDREIKDLDVAVRYARELGYRRVAIVGFSMGASVGAPLRRADRRGGRRRVGQRAGALVLPGHGADAPGALVGKARLGRAVTRTWLKTRISPAGWNPVPMPPDEAAALISPIPLLIVHGDQDMYFPVHHGQRLYDAAQEPRSSGSSPGSGTRSPATGPLLDRIAGWVRGHALVQEPISGVGAEELP